MTTNKVLLVSENAVLLLLTALLLLLVVSCATQEPSASSTGDVTIDLLLLEECPNSPVYVVSPRCMDALVSESYIREECACEDNYEENCMSNECQDEAKSVIDCLGLHTVYNSL